MAQRGKRQNFRQQRTKSLARAPEPPDVDRAETRREEHPRRGLHPREDPAGAVEKIQRVEGTPLTLTRMARQPNLHLRQPPLVQTPFLLPTIHRATHKLPRSPTTQPTTPLPKSVKKPKLASPHPPNHTQPSAPTQPKDQTRKFPINERCQNIPRTPLPDLPEGLGLAITFI
jgi:hypothetical protein